MWRRWLGPTLRSGRCGVELGKFPLRRLSTVSSPYDAYSGALNSILGKVDSGESEAEARRVAEDLRRQSSLPLYMWQRAELFPGVLPLGNADKPLLELAESLFQKVYSLPESEQLSAIEELRKEDPSCWMRELVLDEFESKHKLLLLSNRTVSDNEKAEMISRVQELLLRIKENDSKRPSYVRFLDHPHLPGSAFLVNTGDKPDSQHAGGDELAKLWPPRKGLGVGKDSEYDIHDDLYIVDAYARKPVIELPPVEADYRTLFVVVLVIFGIWELSKLMSNKGAVPAKIYLAVTAEDVGGVASDEAQEEEDE